MKTLFIMMIVAFTACCSSKNARQSTDGGISSDTMAIASNPPACIKSLIAQFEKEAVQNPPRKIYGYTYNGKVVYYVPAICCDFFSDLYDSNCKLIGHPDGGITGKGDGSLPDFNVNKTNEVLMWQDKRGK